MTNWKNNHVLIMSILLSGLMLASCTSEKKPQPSPPAVESKSAGASGTSAARVVSVEPGVAGGVIEDTTKVAVKVSAVDAASRRVTLVDDSGNQTTFTAGPEVRNLDQLRAGDKVNVTLNERLVVYVRSGGGEEASNAY